MVQINFEPFKNLGNIPEFNGDNRDLQTFLNLRESQGLFSDLIKSNLKGKNKEIIEKNYQATS